MPSQRVHLRSKKRPETSACGLLDAPTTERLVKVTCLNCLRRVSVDDEEAGVSLEDLDSTDLMR